MTVPAVALRNFAWALVIGAMLGICYGFLRPLRPKHPHLSDLLFLPAAFYGWLYLGFGICGGDLRLGCSLGLLWGGLLWELTVGRLLRPVFSGFWHMCAKLWGLILFPFKKFLKKLQFFQNSSC